LPALNDLGSPERRWYREPSRVEPCPAVRTPRPTDQNSIEACPVANIKSQIKRNRQNEAAHERNKSVKSALKSAVRKFRQAAEAGDADRAKELAKDAAKKLDKAASKGVIHKNQAANKKSAINKKAAAL
jgi:small subunit ribosomal protein S20